MNVVEMDRTAAAPAAPRERAKAFVYRHTVSFEETNLTGNVYFVRYLAWQGRCREMFLRQFAASVIDELSKDLRLVTIHASCDYYVELTAFDEVEVQMRLAHEQQNRIGLAFEYYLCKERQSTLVARGAQEIGCMRQAAEGLRPTPIPSELASALKEYAGRHQ